MVLCGCDKCLLTHSFDRPATLRSRALGEAQSLRMGVSCAWGPSVFQSGREETTHLTIRNLGGEGWWRTWSRGGEEVKQCWYCGRR